MTTEYEQKHGQSEHQAVVNGPWLPMETAPMDGTPIIAGNGRQVKAIRYWTPEQICEEEGSGHPDDFCGGWYDYDDWEDSFHPKGWIPFPGEAH